MFNLGDYYYSFKKPVWIEIIYVDSNCVEFIQHRIDKDDVRKEGWTSTILPVPFSNYYGKADSEGEVRVKAFEAYCNNNLARFEEQVAYILEPLITVKVKPSDVKWMSQYIKEYI